MMGTGIVGLSLPAGRDQRRKPDLRRRAAGRSDPAIDPDWNNGHYEKNPTHIHIQAAAAGGSFHCPRSAARHPGVGAGPVLLRTSSMTSVVDADRQG